MQGTVRISGRSAVAIALVAVMVILVLIGNLGTAQAQTLYQASAPTLEVRQGGIVVRWDEPTVVDATRSHYEIQLREQGGEWQTILFYSTNHRHHTIWGVSSDTDYDVRVKVVAKDTDLKANDGVVASIRTLPAPPGSTPTLDSEKKTYRSPSTDPPPLSHYDANGEPHGKADFRQCSGGVACNE